jgi:hypothetical protein
MSDPGWIWGSDLVEAFLSLNHKNVTGPNWRF